MENIDRSRKMVTIVLIAASAFAGMAVSGISEASAARYDKTCGIKPGDFAYGYVRAGNTSCARARAVTTKATKKFCARHNNCRFLVGANFIKRYRGKLYRNGWKCKVTVAVTYWRSKCRRGNMRVIGRAAIF